MKTTDVSNSGMRITNIDGEDAGVDQCACGATFSHWDYQISISPKNPFVCPHCHNKFYFSYGVKFWRIDE